MADLMKEQLKKEEKELKLLEKRKKKEEKALRRERKKAIDDVDLMIKEEKKNRPLTEEELLIRQKNEPPHLSILEEIGNSVTHCAGAILGIVALVMMLLKSTDGKMVLASIVYGLSIIIMMLMSGLYHAWRSGSTVKRLWRRFDYSSIYLLIGGTFAPLQLIELNQNNNVPIYWGYIWFSVMWALIITGITFTCIFGPGRVRKINYPLYFTIGWTGLIYLPIWIIHERYALLFWILGGGIVYTLGMIPFVKKGVKGAHFIWHFFVLAGAITQFIGIYLYVYC